MKKQRVLLAVTIVSLLAVAISVFAQMNRPWRNGSVWELSFVQMKPGMDDAYLKYVATDWKKLQEALKAQGIVLSYKVLETEGHTPGDWNLILMSEFKDLASLEANEAKADAIGQQVAGNDEKQIQGYKERAEIREVMGTRLAREIILEPRQQFSIGCTKSSGQRFHLATFALPARGFPPLRYPGRPGGQQRLLPGRRYRHVPHDLNSSGRHCLVSSPWLLY